MVAMRFDKKLDIFINSILHHEIHQPKTVPRDANVPLGSR